MMGAVRYHKYCCHFYCCIYYNESWFVCHHSVQACFCFFYCFLLQKLIKSMLMIRQLYIGKVKK